MKDTLLFREILQQPEVLGQLLAREEPTITALAQAINGRSISHVIIAARGTSDNAGRYAQYLLGAFNGLQVALATPSLFTIYRRPIHFKDALVLGISQSGKSPDIVAVLAEARRQGQLTAVLTNNPTSDLGRQADFVIDLGAGAEKSVAATKTYTAQLMALAMLSTALANDHARWDQLHAIPHAVRQALTLEQPIAQIAPRYRYMQRSVVIGRGFNYATAFELALKIKELTYTIVEPYSSADFLHGPLALIEPGFPVMVVAPSGVMQPEMETFMNTLRARQAEIIAFSDADAILDLARIPLRLPITSPEWLSPIPAIVPGQLFAMHLAHTRDYDVDHPRAIRKVTKTR